MFEDYYFNNMYKKFNDYAPSNNGLDNIIDEVNEIINSELGGKEILKKSSRKKGLKLFKYFLNLFEITTSLRLLRKHKYYEYLKSYLPLRERQICARTLIDFLQNREEYNRVYQNFADLDSRNTLVYIIKLRIASLFLGVKAYEKINLGFNLTDYERLIKKYRYKNLVKLEKGETIIDAGAYVGKDSINFASINGFKNVVYALEPQKDSFKSLLLNVSNEMYDGVIFPLKLGVWSTNVKQKLIGHGSSASLVCSPTIGINSYEEIDCIAIDEYFNDVKIDFIKMDVEGAELEALIGAKKTIEYYKPKLAISVYHRVRDLVDIPLFLKRLRPDYELYLQQIHPGIKETILFAI